MIADPVRDTYITVVASGAKEVLSTTGQPVSIVGVDEIAAVQGADIARILERLPGVTLSRNGGPGNFTGIRVRGADSEQLLVLADGVRVADIASPAGGFDFGTLLPGSIGKIELLRGSNSTIWGSQAMGGVMAIETLEGDYASASAEYGGPGSAYAQAALGRSLGALELSLDGALLDSDGISSAAIGSEPDGIHQWQTGGRARFTVTDGFSLRAALRHLDAQADGIGLDQGEDRGIWPHILADIDQALLHQSLKGGQDLGVAELLALQIDHGLGTFHLLDQVAGLI